MLSLLALDALANVASNAPAPPCWEADLAALPTPRYERPTEVKDYREFELSASPAPACEQKRACGRKIKKCAKKARKKPWKRLKCSKKWGKDADGACTNPKTQRKCPKSCGLCG